MNLKNSAILLGLCTAALLSGCGGGGGDSTADQGASAPPAPPPPPVVAKVDFTGFIKEQLRAPVSETTADVDTTEFVFNDEENERAFDDIIAE